VYLMATGERVLVRDAKMARNNRVNLELECQDGPAMGAIFFLTGDELEINMARSSAQS